MCPNKIIKTFLIEDFLHLPPVSATLVANLELRISQQIFEKIRIDPNGIWRSGFRENCSMKKKPGSKKSHGTVPLMN
jgi:hypothetical protein